jgi:hypothetical protein
MNAKTLKLWTERALQAQGRIKRKPRRARQVFYVFKSDFLKLERRIGRRLAAQLKAEELPHLMDIDECSAGDWGGIPNM